MPSRCRRFPLIVACLLAAPGLLHAVAAAGGDSSLRRAEIAAELDRLPEFLTAPQTFERLGFHGRGTDPAWVVVDLGARIVPEKIVVFPATPPEAGPASGTGFPSAFDVQIADDESFGEFVTIASWREATPGSGERLPLVTVPGNGAAGRYLRLWVRGFRDDPRRSEGPFFQLGEIVVLADGRNAALRAPVRATASIDSSRRWEPMNLTDGYFWCLALRGTAEAASEGFQTSPRAKNVTDGSAWVEVDLGEPREIDEVHLVPAHPRQFADLPGYGFPTHFRVLVDPDTPASQVILAEDEPPPPEVALPNPGSSQLMIATPGLRARRIRVVCDGLWQCTRVSGQGTAGYLFALADLQCWQRGRNLAGGMAVRCSDADTSPGWSTAALVDDHSSRHRLIGWQDWLAGLDRRMELEAELGRIDRDTAAARVKSLSRWLLAALLGLTGVSAAAATVVIWQRRQAAHEHRELQRRLARDLHDELGASLSHLAIQSDLARQELQRAESPEQRLAELSATAREAIDHMRDLVWLLAPAEGSWQELGDRLEAIARRHLDGVGHDLRVEGRPPSGRPPVSWSRDILSFFKETLTNVRLHAGASRVRVGITWDDSLTIDVEDDGRGFVLPAAGDAAPGHGGHGLTNLHQRAVAVGGRLTIDSQPGRGTRVRLVAPLQDRPRSNS
jgi:signal transduction histidine kinase